MAQNTDAMDADSFETPGDVITEALDALDGAEAVEIDTGVSTHVVEDGADLWTDEEETEVRIHKDDPAKTWAGVAPVDVESVQPVEDEEFVPDDVDREDYLRMTTARVRALVEDVFSNARGREPEVEVLKAGDTGVMFRARYEGGCVGRRFFSTVEEHGFQIADLNTGSGKILVRDRTKVED